MYWDADNCHLLWDSAFFLPSTLREEVRLAERDLDRPLSEESPVGSGGFESLFPRVLVDFGLESISVDFARVAR